MEEAKPEEKELKGKYSIVEIATQTEPRISDGKNIYTMQEALVLTLNQIEEMKKKIVGE